jgi:hypothetical protein
MKYSFGTDRGGQQLRREDAVPDAGRRRRDAGKARTRRLPQVGQARRGDQALVACLARRAREVSAVEPPREPGTRRNRQLEPQHAVDDATADAPRAGLQDVRIYRADGVDEPCVAARQDFLDHQRSARSATALAVGPPSTTPHAGEPCDVGRDVGRRRRHRRVGGQEGGVRTLVRAGAGGEAQQHRHEGRGADGRRASGHGAGVH